MRSVLARWSVPEEVVRQGHQIILDYLDQVVNSIRVNEAPPLAHFRCGSGDVVLAL